MMGTGETLTILSERKPQSERAALEARAARQWRLVKIVVSVYQEIGRLPITNDNQRDWKAKRDMARSYLGLWRVTRDRIAALQAHKGE